VEAVDELLIEGAEIGLEGIVLVLISVLVSELLGAEVVPLFAVRLEALEQLDLAPGPARRGDTADHLVVVSVLGALRRKVEIDVERRPDRLLRVGCLRALAARSALAPCPALAGGLRGIRGVVAGRGDEGE